jgi:hypothetical protein
MRRFCIGNPSLNLNRTYFRRMLSAETRHYIIYKQQQIWQTNTLSFFWSQLYRASWYYQSLLFTNWCTMELLLKKNIKTYIKTAPTCFGLITITREHIIWYVMIYVLTAIGLSPDGSSTVHIYTQTIYRTIQNKQYIEQHKNFGRVRAVPRLGELYPGICLTTEEKARKTLNRGSRTIRIHKPSNKNA